MRVQPCVHSETELRETLDQLYEASKQGKSFTGILELAMCEITIITAIHNIKANDGAHTPGADRMEIDNYLQMPYKRTIGLVQSAFRRYDPRPVRRVYIPKRNGKMRPLGIPAMVDRIVQECIRIVLEPILEARFFEHSYGFRPYRATRHAIKHVIIHAEDSPWVIEGDIKGYFDNVDHSLLIRKLWRLGVIDKRILAIIHKMLKAGVVEHGKWQPTNRGTPQGGILSPLLANAYLTDFDWTIARRWQIPSFEREYTQRYAARHRLRRHRFAGCFLTRYADDWVIQCRTESQAQKLLQELQRYFRQRLRLELSEEKTVITDMRQRPINFLGFSIVAEPPRAKPGMPRSKMLVGKAYPNPERLRAQARTLTDMVHAAERTPHITEFAAHIERTNAVLIGYAEYWRSGISKKALSRLDHAVYGAARAVFRRHFGRIGLHRYLRPLDELANRPLRHAGQKTRTWAVPVEDMWVGFTRADITPIRYERYCFDQRLTPYTAEGRELFQLRFAKRLPMNRPPMYDTATLSRAGRTKGRYNFEYMMNREYAFNRDRGQCRCCGQYLPPGDRHCHHVRPWLPLAQVNKVGQLAWVCTECHRLIHASDSLEGLRYGAKIQRMRRLLRQPSDLPQDRNGLPATTLAQRA